MRANAIQVVSCLGLLFVGFHGDCKQGVCASDNSACRSLEIVASTPRLAKTMDGTFAFSFKSNGSIGSDTRFELATTTRSVLSRDQILPTIFDSMGMTMSAQLPVPKGSLDSVALGRMDLLVLQKDGFLSGATDTWIYTPPNLMDGIRLASSDITDESVKELGAPFIQPVPNQGGSLFFGEKYDRNFFTYRRLVRYDFDQRTKTLAVASSFPNAGQLVARDPGTQFAITQKAVAMNWLIGMAAQFQLYGLADDAALQLAPIQTGSPPTNPLLAADPTGDSMAIATNKEVLLYSVTSPDKGKLSVTLLGSCLLPALAGFQPVALGVQHVGPESMRRVIVVTSDSAQRSVTVCEATDSAPAMQPLSENSLLEGCLQPQLDMLPLRQPVALTIGDLDADGLPDLVYVPTNSQKTLYYIPYALRKDPTSSSDCRFLPRQTVTLPSEAATVQAIAVGDLDGNGRPDVALTTASPAELRIFWNMPPM